MVGKLIALMDFILYPLTNTLDKLFLKIRHLASSLQLAQPLLDKLAQLRGQLPAVQGALKGLGGTGIVALRLQ